MAWEHRDGRRYLYRSVRRGRRVVREYLGTGPIADLMASELDEVRLVARDAAQRDREQFETLRLRIDAVTTPPIGADQLLRAVVDQLMALAGYHRHKRGPWRLRRNATMAASMKKAERNWAELVERLKGEDLTEEIPGLLPRYDAPAGDVEAVDLFKRARAGDQDAVAKLSDLFERRGWWSWIGKVDKYAADVAVCLVAAVDPVARVGLDHEAKRILTELLGPNPTMLELLLARRIQLAWLAVARLELEQMTRPQGSFKAEEHLDKKLTRAQRRLCEASRALAAIRRLPVPAVVAQVNINTPQGLPAAPGPKQLTN